MPAPLFCYAEPIALARVREACVLLLDGIENSQYQHQFCPILISSQCYL